MKNNWIDETNRSYANPSSAARIWMLETSIIVRVHRHVWLEKDEWAVSCRELGIDTKLLKNKDVELAKNEAIEIIKEQLNTKICRYEEAILELK